MDNAFKIYSKKATDNAQICMSKITCLLVDENIIDVPKLTIMKVLPDTKEGE